MSPEKVDSSSEENSQSGQKGTVLTAQDLIDRFADDPNVVTYDRETSTSFYDQFCKKQSEQVIKKALNSFRISPFAIINHKFSS